MNTQWGDLPYGQDFDPSEDAPGRKDLIWVTGGFPLSVGLPSGGSQTPSSGARSDARLEPDAGLLDERSGRVGPIKIRLLQ